MKDAIGLVTDPAAEALPADAAGFVFTPVESKTLAWLFTLGITAGLAWAFRAYGTFTVMLLVMYLAGLVATQLSVHWVVRTLDFPYPSYLTFLQFAVLMVILGLFYDIRNLRVPDVGDAKEMQFMSSRFVTFYIRNIAPIGIAIALCTVTNNASLKLISPGLNAIIASMTPVCTGLLSALCGTRYASKAWFALLIATCGGFVTVQGGVREMERTVATMQTDSGKSFMGILLAFISLVLRAMKTVVIEWTVRPQSAGKHVCQVTSTPRANPTLSPSQTLVLQTPLVVAVAFFMAFIDPAGLMEPTMALTTLQERPQLAIGILVNVVAANTLQILGLVIVRLIGATSMQLAGKFNIFIVMALSAAYTGEIIPLDEWAGAMVTLVAANMFSAATRPCSASVLQDIESLARRHGKLGS